MDESREKEMQALLSSYPLFCVVTCRVVICSCALLRLSDQLQYMSSKQSLAKMEADIAKFNVWSTELQDHNNREGHFDVRYLHERFQRGKGKVADFMRTNHLFTVCDNLQQAQAEILKYQHSFADGTPPTLAMTACNYILHC